MIATRIVLVAAMVSFIARDAAATEVIDYGTRRNDVRSCPVNMHVVGVDLDGNRLLCSDSFGPYEPAAVFETLSGNRDLSSTRACREGYAVTGVSPVRNSVACSHAGLMESFTDATTMRMGMHACPTGTVVIGVHLRGNGLLCGRRVDFCFGGLGQRCGVTKEGLATPFALCVAGVCWINAGSWIHDECCWRFPNGFACRGGPQDVNDGHCGEEFSLAVAHLAAGYSWTRSVSFNERTLNGAVRFNAYCAPAGTIVHRNNVSRCCSRMGRALDPIGDAPRITSQKIYPTEILAGNPRVCRA
ncbi:MAG TPA: hypothetical protein VF042_16455 [Gemmatimonadaceae bacterium]